MVKPGTALLRRQIEDRPARCKQKRMERNGKKLRPEIEIRARLFIGRRKFELDRVAVPVLDPDLGLRKPRQWIGGAAVERDFVGKSPQRDCHGQPNECQSQRPEHHFPTQLSGPCTTAQGLTFRWRRGIPGRAWSPGCHGGSYVLPTACAEYTATTCFRRLKMEAVIRPSQRVVLQEIPAGRSLACVRPFYAPAFFSIFAQVSFSGRVRLKTSRSGAESGSRQK